MLLLSILGGDLTFSTVFPGWLARFRHWYDNDLRPLVRLHGELRQAGGQTVLERSGWPQAKKQLFLLEDESRWHAVTGCWYSTQVLFTGPGRCTVRTCCSWFIAVLFFEELSLVSWSCFPGNCLGDYALPLRAYTACFRGRVQSSVSPLAASCREQL